MIIDTPRLRRLLNCVGVIAGIGAGIVTAPIANAQPSPSTWPTHPVTMVVPFPPGGGTDSSARMLAERLGALLETTFVVENKPGATGNIGNELVARSAPDGYTVLIQGTIIGMFPHIFTRLNYDPNKDLQAVGTIAESPTVLVVAGNSRFKTLQDLVAAAKASPDKPLTFGSAGVGSPQHLAVEQLSRAVGVHTEHVTYRGSTPALTDLMGGQTDFGAFSLTSAQPFIASQKLKVLALLSAQPSALLPGAQTTAQLGYPVIDSSIRFALFVPRNTPPAVIAKLAAANTRALADPALRQRFATAGYEVVTGTPAETAAMVRHQYELWGPIVKELGLKID